MYNQAHWHWCSARTPDLRASLWLLSCLLALVVGSQRLAPGADFHCRQEPHGLWAGRLGLGGVCNWSRSRVSEGPGLHKNLSQGEMNPPISPYLLALSPDLHRFAIHPASSDAVSATR